MRRSLQLIICPALSIALHACALKPGTPTPQADLILTGGAIHTMDAQRSRAEAIAVRAGRIVYVGAAAEAETFRGPATRVVDLGNRMLLPSFQDVHIHPTLGGTAYSECPLFDTGNVDDILAVIRGCIDANSEAEYISATGWRWSQFVDAQPPHKSTLDQLDFTGPIITGDADGHTLWVNSAALELAQITGSTPDPEGSEIGRDADGSPNGILKEGPAMDMVQRRLPPPTRDTLVRALEYTQGYLHSLGITAIQDAYVRLDSADIYQTLDAYAYMRDRGDLDLRVITALNWEPGAGMAQIDAMMHARAQY